MNGKPVSVPDEHTAAVRTMVEQRLPSDPHPYLSEGMRVRIKRGLLAGAEGILGAKKQKHRLFISVDLMQQAVAADVDSADVEPLESRVWDPHKPPPTHQFKIQGVREPSIAAYLRPVCGMLDANAAYGSYRTDPPRLPWGFFNLATGIAVVYDAEARCYGVQTGSRSTLLAAADGGGAE